MDKLARYYSPSLEKLSREDILNIQNKRLISQIEYIYNTNSFYRNKFKEAHIKPEDIKSVKDLKRLPISTKKDFVKDQEEHPPYGHRLGIPVEKIAHITTTAGTSGQGVELHCLTARDLQTAINASAMAFYWCGLRRGEVAVFNVGLGNHIGGWIFLEGIRALGQASYLIGHLSFIDRLTHMQKYGVHGMWASVSMLNGLSVLCQEQGIDPKKAFPNLKFILVAAEPHALPWALKMEEFWGAKIFEDYGSSQSAAISASTCEQGVAVDNRRGIQHFYEWGWVQEVIDPNTGEDVLPGETGELVVTCLEKEASPVIRFGTKDRVRYLPYTYCKCGRALDGIEAGTISRLDDMIKVKGTNFWPVQVDNVLFTHEEVEEYQGRVFIGIKGRDEIEILLAFKDKYRELPEQAKSQIMNAISEDLKKSTELTMKVIEIERDKLPVWHTPERKARRWTDERLKQMASG